MIGARKPGRPRRRADQALVQQRKRDRDRARAYRGGRRDVRRAGIEADDPRLVSVQQARGADPSGAGVDALVHAQSASLHRGKLEPAASASRTSAKRRNCLVGGRRSRYGLG